ncbi:TMS membrane protein [Tritrichomonas foetus]|uniref:TMS membrane protein n=1 Tax=Tritrichomonas foetus TaxID=1144522 RepID=A0A1J4J897_9EUKA|nr:TMS membrane protein [Tritrichomonas foetus]|eukprot:OHS95406.1 TMS membrane protein [Tritrichomonas foetus]
MDYGYRGFEMNDDDYYDADRALKIANIFYVIFFFIFGIFSFVVFNNGEKWLGKIVNTKYTEDYMIRLSCVVRTTCPMAVWYLLHAIITICNTDLNGNTFQFKFHTSLLWIHAISYGIITAAFWFIPDAFYSFYLEFSIYASGIYLVMQLIFLIDFFNTLNEKLVNVNKLWIIGVITAVLGVGSLVAFGVSYYIFTFNDCNDHKIFISINMCCCFALFVAAAFIPHGSIFTASLVTVYVAYLTIAGMICLSQCNRLTNGGKPMLWLSIIASLITLTLATYSAFASSNQLDACSFTVNDEESNNYRNDLSDNTNVGKKPKFSLSFFHLLFMFASIYITMIVTHWGKAGEDAAWTIDKGVIARWVNFASSWAIIILYAWSLVAPYIFKNRNFD